MTYDDEKIVYRLYDAVGQLLYVGCTLSLKQRLAHHACGLWGDQIARAELAGPFGSRRAQAIEWKQIGELAPLHNKMGNYHRGWDYLNGSEGIGYFPERDEFRSAA